MTALVCIADSRWTSRHVREVPTALYAMHQTASSPGPSSIRSLIATPVISERRVHGVDGNCRDESRNKEPEKANSDRKCARQRLPRDEIPVTNREAGDESEIDRIPERPVLHKTSQQAQGKLNPQNCRQHRPRHVNGMAERREKAPPQRFRRRPVHVVTTSVNGALQKR